METFLPVLGAAIIIVAIWAVIVLFRHAKIGGKIRKISPAENYELKWEKDKEGNEKPFIRGDSGYVVPWALFVNGDNAYLNANFSLHRFPGGTVSMLVEWKENGLHVHLPYGEKFSKADIGPYLLRVDYVHYEDRNGAKCVSKIFPGEYKERYVREMEVGDKGWVVPWALSRETLNPNSTLDDAPGGTVTTLVVREMDGMHVWLPEGEGCEMDSLWGNEVPIVGFYAEKPAE